jgi:hypothetical protein
MYVCWRYQFWTGVRVAQWVRSLDLTTHTSLSPIWCGLASGFVNYKKCALDLQSQVIKFTSCLSMVGGSLQVLRLPPPLKLDAWYSWNIVESGVKTPKIKIELILNCYDGVVFFCFLILIHSIKNRESIRDATAELQVKISWSCFINK